MMIKKVVICLSLFTMILLLAGMMNVRMEGQRRETLGHPASTISYSILSTQIADKSQPVRQFHPREYVRIVKKLICPRQHPALGFKLSKQQI